MKDFGWMTILFILFLPVFILADLVKLQK